MHRFALIGSLSPCPRYAQASLLTSSKVGQNNKYYIKSVEGKYYNQGWIQSWTSLGELTHVTTLSYERFAMGIVTVWGALNPCLQLECTSILSRLKLHEDGLHKTRALHSGVHGYLTLS